MELSLKELFEVPTERNIVTVCVSRLCNIWFKTKCNKVWDPSEISPVWFILESFVREKFCSSQFCTLYLYPPLWRS
jgi:hypothetical protein